MNRIKELRVEKHKTQKEIADFLKVVKSSIGVVNVKFLLMYQAWPQFYRSDKC